jgi:hypothetical protein
MKDRTSKEYETEADDHAHGARVLRSPAEQYHDQDNENDPADPNSAVGSICVVTAATAKEQKQDQDQQQR